MKLRILCALVALSVLVLIGCTACDSDPAASAGLDPAEHLDVLCCPTGWHAMEDSYTFNDGYDDFQLEGITLRQTGTEEEPVFLCTAENPDDEVFDGGEVGFASDGAVAHFDQIGSYTLKLTTNPDESELVLSLTALDESAAFNKLYFSLEGGAE